IVVPTSNGTLVAVVDGLGHGADAAEAARIAISIIQKYAADPLIALIRHCHDSMRYTRGAVMSLAFFSRQNLLNCISIGNVQGVLFSARNGGKHQSIIIRGGVVGSHLPPLQPVALPVSVGDTLIFATDGIRAGFDEDLSMALPLSRIAHSVCEQCSKGTD